MSMDFSEGGYLPPHFTIVNFNVPKPTLLAPQLPVMGCASPLAWQTAKARFTAFSLAFSRGKPCGQGFVFGWLQSSGVQARYRLVTSQFTPLNHAGRFRYGRAGGLSQHLALAWGALNVADQSAGLVWLTRIGHADRVSRMVYGQLKPQDKRYSVHFWHVGFDKLEYDKPVYTPPLQDEVNFTLSVGARAHVMDFHPLPARQPFAQNSAQSVQWGKMDEANRLSRVVWQTGMRAPQPEWGKPTPPPKPPEPNPLPPQPQHQPVSIVMNSIQILSMPEQKPLQGALSVRLDVDSYCWTSTLTIQGKHQLAALRPTANGPRELRITLNGYVFVLFVEKIDRVGQFPSETYTVQASSYHRQFGAPWAPKLSDSIETNRSAVQIMESLLAGTGFTLERPTVAEWQQTPDWTLAAGSYSYANKTPIEVMQELCEAVGAVLIPHPSERRWRLQPRYLVSPWLLDVAPANAFSHVIPAGLNLDWQSQSAPEPAANGVLVSGVNIGVAVDVTRTGSNGTQRGGEYYSDLHQDVQQCTERGRNELAKAGHKELMTINLPLMTQGVAPELVMPGRLAMYQNPSDSSANFRGVVLSVQLSTSRPQELRQQVVIEVDHGND
ncbi:hypothetical protein MM188_003227 [Vibrio cholerae]|nr:hypothetical protein [Vibrio cholerae]